jgi:hypothetical protein
LGFVREEKEKRCSTNWLNRQGGKTALGNNEEVPMPAWIVDVKPEGVEAMCLPAVVQLHFADGEAYAWIWQPEAFRSVRYDEVGPDQEPNMENILGELQIERFDPTKPLSPYWAARQLETMLRSGQPYPLVDISNRLTNTVGSMFTYFEVIFEVPVDEIITTVDQPEPANA